MRGRARMMLSYRASVQHGKECDRRLSLDDDDALGVHCHPDLRPGQTGP